MATSASVPGGVSKLGLGAALAALVWAVGLGVADAVHIMAAGDVDTAGFVVAVLALAPAWAFIGRNVSISVFGQKATVTITAQDVAAASGQPPEEAGDDAEADGEQAAPTPLEHGARQLHQLANWSEPWLHPEAVNALRVNANLMREHAAAPPREVAMFDPPPTGDAAIDLRNRIMVRLTALARKSGIAVGHGDAPEIVLAALTAAGVLKAAESTALAKFIKLGNEVERGRAPIDDDASLVAQSQVGILANLDRKLSDA